MCCCLERQRKSGGRAVVLPLVRASMFLCVPLPPPTAVRPAQRTENEACCVWKDAAVPTARARYVLL